MKKIWFGALTLTSLASTSSAQYNHLWSRYLNGPLNTVDSATRTTVDEQGNIYTAGTTALDTNSQFADLVIAKYNPQGVLLWRTAYNGDGNGQDICQDLEYRNGVLAVAGRVSRPVIWYADSDLLTLKMNAETGAIEWARTFSGPGNSAFESSIDDGRAVAVASDGSIAITGLTWQWEYYFSNADYRTVKYDANGNMMWNRQYHGGATYIAISDVASLITFDQNDDVVISGDSPAPNNASEWATIKYDGTTGDPIWIKRSADVGSNYRGVPTTLKVATNNDIYVAGRGFNDSQSIIRYAGATGDVVWSWNQRIGHNGLEASFAIDPVTDDAVLGVTWDPDVDDSNLNNNTRIVKFRAADGFKLWTADYGNSNYRDYQAVRAINVLPSGNIVMAGKGPNASLLTRLLILQYSPGGALQWQYTHDSEALELETRQLEYDFAGNLIIGGHGYGTPSGTTDLTVMKFAPETEVVPPTGMTILSGELFGGSMANLALSDNQALWILNDENQPNAILRVSGTTLKLNPVQLEFEVESASDRSDQILLVAMRNFDTMQMETVANSTVSQTDQVFVTTIASNPGRFVSPIGEVEATITVMPMEDLIAVDGWSTSFDCSIWRVQ